MSVITLGGLAGGGARLLGPKLSEKLGADYIDRNIISTIACNTAYRYSKSTSSR